MPASVDPFHLRVARIALSAAHQYGFALGGGLALISYGVVDRPTEDIDLFTNRDGEVPAAADVVWEALVADGIDVGVESPDGELDDLIDGLAGHIAELVAYRDAVDDDGVRLSLGELYRARAPVVHTIGPVLHLDDLRAWKVAALVDRAEVRDFVDVSAFLATHSPGELISLARAVDPGIGDEDVAAVGVRLDRTRDADFSGYGLDAPAVTELRRRFAGWPRPPRG